MFSSLLLDFSFWGLALQLGAAIVITGFVALALVSVTLGRSVLRARLLVAEGVIGGLGVTTAANGSITSRIIVIASGSRRASPLAATITGSTTTFGILRMRIRSATAPIISVRESIPVFAAAIVKSSATASICAATKAGSRLATALTPRVFCAVIAVMALVPKTANAAKVLRSAWIPAPPLESEPAMVSATAVMVHKAYHEN